MDEMKNKIMEILAEEVSLGGAKVEDKSSFRDDLELDSLDLSVFFLAIQETYDVEISDNDVAELDTVAQIVAWLSKQK